MTEKIERRGIRAPNAYKPDVLQNISVLNTMDKAPVLICIDNKTDDIKQWLLNNISSYQNNLLIITDKHENFIGYIETGKLLNANADNSIQTIVSKNLPVAYAQQSLATISDLMGNCDMQCIAVIDPARNNKVTGIITANNILQAYSDHHKEEKNYQVSLSVKRRTKKLLIKSRSFMQSTFSKENI